MPPTKLSLELRRIIRVSSPSGASRQKDHGGRSHQLRGILVLAGPVGEPLSLAAHGGSAPIIRARTSGSVTNTGALSSPSMASFTDIPPSTDSTCPVM